MEECKDDVFESVVEDGKRSKKDYDKVLFSTRLRKPLIRELKILSAKSGKKIYEIVEEAVERYINDNDNS